MLWIEVASWATDFEAGLIGDPVDWIGQDQITLYYRELRQRSHSNKAGAQRHWMSDAIGVEMPTAYEDLSSSSSDEAVEDASQNPVRASAHSARRQRRSRMRFVQTGNEWSPEELEWQQRQEASSRVELVDDDLAMPSDSELDGEVSHPYLKRS